MPIAASRLNSRRFIFVVGAQTIEHVKGPDRRGNPRQFLEMGYANSFEDVVAAHLLPDVVGWQALGIVLCLHRGTSRFNAMSEKLTSSFM
jgi:hypothetical protein